MIKGIKCCKCFAITIFLIIFVTCAHHLSINSLEDIVDYAKEYPEYSFLILLGLYCLKSVILVIPLSLLYVVAGILFSPTSAIIITYICVSIEMTIVFYIGRYMGRSYVLDKIRNSKKGKQILRYSSENSIVSCFIIRLLPGIPSDVLTMFIGTTNIKYIGFIIGTLLGLTPRLIPAVLMGKAITNPLSLEFLIPFGICSLFSIFSLYIYRIRRKNDKLEDIQEEGFEL